MQAPSWVGRAFTSLTSRLFPSFDRDPRLKARRAGEKGDTLLLHKGIFFLSTLLFATKFFFYRIKWTREEEEEKTTYYISVRHYHHHRHRRREQNITENNKGVAFAKTCASSGFICKFYSYKKVKMKNRTRSGHGRGAVSWRTPTHLLINIIYIRYVKKNIYITYIIREARCGRVADGGCTRGEEMKRWRRDTLK